jgi:O-antigen ligase
MNNAGAIFNRTNWWNSIGWLLNPDWLFYLAVATLPLESLVTSEIVTIPKIVGMLAFGSWVLASIVQRRKVYWGVPLVTMGLFILWGVVSLVWTLDFSRTRSSVITYTLLMMFYVLIINSVRTRDQLDKTLIAVWAGGMVVVASAIFQVATTSFEASLYSQRVAGFIGNPNTYAVWALAAVPGFYWMIVRGWKSVTGVLAIFGLVAMLVTILYSASRGGAVSVVALVLCFLLLNRKKWQSLAIVIVVAILVWCFAPPLFWTRLSQFTAPAVVVGDRMRDLWPAGWNAFLGNPWIGSGLGTNELVIRSVIGKLLSVHSAPLAVAIEVGIFGVLTYLAFICIPPLQLLKSATLKRQAALDLKGLVPIVLASFVAFLVSWVKGGGLEYSKILWLMLGLMTAITTIIQSAMSVSGITDHEQDAL